MLVAIEPQYAESRRFIPTPLKVQPGLFQAEQIEMVDQESRPQHDQPTHRVQRPENRCGPRALKRVHQRLNAGRAITLCCTAKSPSSTALITIAVVREPVAPESMDFGTMKLPTKPTLGDRRRS